MWQLGIELLTSVRRARSLPSEAHRGLCEAAGQLVAAPRRKPAGLILLPVAHFPAAGQVPDKRRLLLPNRHIRSHGNLLQYSRNKR